MTSRTPTVSRRDVGLISPLTTQIGSSPAVMDDGEDLQMDQNMVMAQELLRATTVASTEQRKLFSSQSEVEKSAFILENFTRPDWISFVSYLRK